MSDLYPAPHQPPRLHHHGSFPKWHGLAQTHFPPRTCKHAWHSDITNVICTRMFALVAAARTTCVFKSCHFIRADPKSRFPYYMCITNLHALHLHYKVASSEATTFGLHPPSLPMPVAHFLHFDHSHTLGQLPSPLATTVAHFGNVYLRFGQQLHSLATSTFICIDSRTLSQCNDSYMNFGNIHLRFGRQVHIWATSTFWCGRQLHTSTTLRTLTTSTI